MDTRRRVIILMVGTLMGTLASSAQGVVINWCYVDNPGNRMDIDYGYGYGAHGAVPYTYLIGMYDVTIDQYVEFLNTKDPTGTNTLGLFNSDMSDALYGGIVYVPGNLNGNKYNVVAGHGNYPVNFVTWYDAVRFANWVNNGQGSGSTETGAYTLLGGTPIPSNATNISRNPGAKVFLPTENEWYKAAYYSPVTSSYYAFPTGTNVPPTATAPPGGPNSANFDIVLNHLTDVGAYRYSPSPYGTFDQGGNLFQWTETLTSDTFRVRRGGGFRNELVTLHAANQDVALQAYEDYHIGFRLAAAVEIPEPASGVIAAAALAGLFWLRWVSRPW